MEGRKSIKWHEGAFACQLVATDEVDPRCAFLRVLTNHALPEDVGNFLREVRQMTDPVETTHASAVMEVSFRPNQMVFDDYYRKDEGIMGQDFWNSITQTKVARENIAAIRAESEKKGFNDGEKKALTMAK